MTDATIGQLHRMSRTLLCNDPKPVRIASFALAAAAAPASTVAVYLRKYRRRTMVATLAQAASASYYLESQRSFRHPNEYYTAGEEPDGVWFNPNGLLGLENGGKVDSSDFQRLYNGFAPDGSTRLTRNAGSDHALARRGHDLLGRQERLRALGPRRSGSAW